MNNIFRPSYDDSLKHRAKPVKYLKQLLSGYLFEPEHCTARKTWSELVEYEYWMTAEDHIFALDYCIHNDKEQVRKVLATHLYFGSFGKLIDPEERFARQLRFLSAMKRKAGNDFARKISAAMDGARWRERFVALMYQFPFHLDEEDATTRWMFFKKEFPQLTHFYESAMDDIISKPSGDLIAYLGKHSLLPLTSRSMPGIWDERHWAYGVETPAQEKQAHIRILKNYRIMMDDPSKKEDIFT